jgi:lysophospholipase L1-like esterase
MTRRARLVVAVLAVLLAAALGAALAAAQPVPPGSIYVALGDSVAAGHGLGAPTDQSDAEVCHRSQLAYPALLGQSPFFANPAGAAGSVACSGAVSANLLDVPQPIGPLALTPQLAVVRALGLAPATVTITAGANDVAFVEVLEACLRQPGAGPSGPCAQQASPLLARLQALHATLTRLIAEVSVLPGPQRILVTGYYDPLPGDLTNIGSALACGVLGTDVRKAQLDGDFAILEAYLRLLNGVIAHAAGAAGAQFVDLSTVMDGHRLCSRSPYVFPIVPRTIADGSAIHPNAAGHVAIAQALVAAVGGAPEAATGPEPEEGFSLQGLRDELTLRP